EGYDGWIPDNAKGNLAVVLKEPTQIKSSIGNRGTFDPTKGDVRLSVDDRVDMLRANATGLDLQSFKRLQKLIEQRHADDLEAGMRRSERDERRKQSADWRQAAAAMRPEVVEDIKQRPDVAADLFLNNGELFGRKVGVGFRIRTDDLTPEQQARLPRSYLRKD